MDEQRPDSDNLAGEVASLSEKLCGAYEEISLVYRLGERMGVGRPAEAFLREACGEAMQVMEVCGAGAFVWDEATGPVPPVVAGDLDLDAATLDRLDAALRLRLSAPGSPDFLLENEVCGDTCLSWLVPAGRQLLAVPLRRHGKTLGCLWAVDKDVPPEVFGTYNDGVFTSADRKLLCGVAVHAALFLENHRLFGDAESLMMGLLHSMTAAVDAKDAYTCGHSVRVALFASRLAKEAGEPADRCARVYLAGLLHDVGKIGVDDAVIRKPGRLTDEEFAQIKRHPEIGHRILERVPGLDDVLPGVLYHHEKVDGRGYPHGLAGEEIPLLGRLMCIADSFDAMTSSRTYRKAMPLADALAEVGRCAGTQFDAALARLFCAIPVAEFERLIARERDGDLPDFAPMASSTPAIAQPVKRAA